MRGCKNKNNYGVTDTTLLQHATFGFKEISNGVYSVVKDRYGMFSKYASNEEVVKYLNSDTRVVILGVNGTHANFEFHLSYVHL